MLYICDPNGHRYLKRILTFMEQMRSQAEHDLELEAAIAYLKGMLGEH